MKNRVLWFCLVALSPWLLAGGSLRAQTNAIPAGVFQFSSATYNVSESESGIQDVSQNRSTPGALITVVRTGGALGKMRVDFATTNATGTNANIAWSSTNYVATNGTLVFEEYQMSASFFVAIKDNIRSNGPRNFQVLLTKAAADPSEDPSLVPALGVTTNAAVTILDNEYGLNFNRLFYRVNGDNNNTITVTVFYGGSISEDITVNCRTGNPANYEPGSEDAVPGVDYVPVDTTLSLSPTSPTGRFELTVLKNPTAGFNKAIGLELYGPSQITIQVPTNETTEVDGTNVTVTNMVDVQVDAPLGNVKYATVTIMVANTSVAGGVDPEYNPELDPRTSPPYNPTPGANNTVYALALQTDNKTIIGGDFTSVNANPRARLARINADGSVDPTFQVGSGADDYIDAIDLDGAGGVFVGGGFSSFNGQPRYRVAKINSDGTLNTGFNPGSTVNGTVRAVLNTANGLLIGGDFTAVGGTSRNSLARLRTDGSLDTSFNPGLGANGSVYSLISLSDGGVVAGGDFTQFNGQSRNSIAKFTGTGAMDPSFNPGNGADGPIYGMVTRVVQAIGVTNVIEDGNENTNTINVGANAGQIQLTFLFAGLTNAVASNTVYLRYNQTNLTTNVVLVDISNSVMRTISASFGPGPATTVEILVNSGVTNGAGSPLWYTGTITPRYADQNRILVGGAFSTFAGQSRNGLVRLNSDGSVDSSFDPGTGVNNAIYAVALGERGTYYVAGLFTSYNRTRRMGLARVLANGKLDTSFMDATFNQFAGMVSGGVSGGLPFINAMKVQSDGGVLIGGNFHLLGGSRSPDSINDPSLYGTNPYLAVYDRGGLATRQNYARLIGGQTPGPGLVEISQDNFYIDENAGIGRITTSRTNGSVGSVSLLITSVDGTAINGVNYYSTNKLVQWADKDTTNYPVEFRIIQDFVVGPDVSFYLTADLPASYLLVRGLPVPIQVAIGRDSAMMTILESDQSPTYLSLSEVEYRVDENAGQALITVNRTGDTSSRVTVDYATKRITGTNAAEPGINYVARAGTLTFDPGQTTKTFAVTINDNTIVDPNRKLQVVLSNPRPAIAHLGTISNADVSIIDNDSSSGQIIFTKAKYEVDENQTNAVIEVKRVGGNVGVATVRYFTLDGTAVNGVHYLATSGFFSWANGESATKSFLVPLIDDQVVDTNHTATIWLTNFVNATVDTNYASATLNIRETDSYGRLEFNATNYLVNDQEGFLMVHVLRKGGTAGTVSVDCGTVASLNGATNYVSVTNTLRFFPGQSDAVFTVKILDLGLATNSSFNLRLSNPSNAALGKATNAVVNVLSTLANRMPAGQLDNSYNKFASVNGFIYTMNLQSNGNLVIGGDFTQVNGVARNHVAQLSPVGNLDLDFSIGGGINGAVRTMVIQPEGRILVGGSFTQVDSVNRNCLARLNLDGSLDMSFNPGSGAQNPIYALAVQTNGFILVGGEFASFNGVSRRGLVRLNSAGNVDLSFDTGAGANGAVYAIAIQPDGRILVGGQFKQFNNQNQAGIIRLNMDGSLDGTFIADVGANDSVRTIAVQLDGKILLGGQFTAVHGIQANHLARLRADGTIDDTFNIGDGANNSVNAIALQLDGKPLIVGDFTLFNGISCGRLVRLNLDGSLDSTITAGSGADGFIAALAVQADRRICLAGGFDNFNGEPRQHLARIFGGGVVGAGKVEFAASLYTVGEGDTNALVTVRRVDGAQGDIQVDFMTQDSAGLAGAAYLPVTNTLVFRQGETRKTVQIPIIENMQVDPDRYVNLILTNIGFVSTNTAVTPVPALGPQPTAALVIKDNDSVIGFSYAYYSVGKDVASGTASILLTRYGNTSQSAWVDYATISGGTASNGVNYRSTSGTVYFAVGESNASFVVPILNDHLASGNKTVMMQLANLSGGTVLSPSLATLTIIETQFSPGQLFLAKSSYSVLESMSEVMITVVRTNGNTGAVSVDYSTSGGTATPGMRYAAAQGTLTFGDGEISKSFSVTIFNDTIRQGGQTVYLVLSNPKGATLRSPNQAVLTILDDDFGPGSLDTNFVSTSLGTVYSLGLQTDGKIVAVGSYTGSGAAITGSVRLNTDGARDSGFASTTITNPVYAVDVTTNGAYVGGAFSRVGTVPRKYVGLLTAAGQANSGFSLSASENGPVMALAAQDDLKVIIGGDFTTPVGGIARLNSDGSLDVSFNPEGGTDGRVNAVALQPDGKVLVGGIFSQVGLVNSLALARLLPTGQVDPSFNLPSDIWSPTYGLAPEVMAIQVQADGKILVGGYFIWTARTTNSTYNGYSLVRLNVDGSLDVDFARNLPSYISGTVRALAVQPDGKIFIGGSFSVSSYTGNNIARLNRDGSYDTNFFAGDGANSTVYALALQSDGKLVVGGNFTTLNGNSARGIGRLLGDSPVKGRFAPPKAQEGSVAITLGVLPGNTYILQSSIDLVDWGNIATNKADGPFWIYADTNAPGMSRRFFRAIK